MFPWLLLLGIINEPTCTYRTNVTQTPLIQKKLLQFQEKECINIQHPYTTVLLNFGHVKIDAYLYIPGGTSDIEHYSRYSKDDFYGIDTGSRIGRIEISALDETDITYSVVTFDADCDERTVSTFDRQVMSYKRTCDEGGCHGDMNKKFCYFNGFEWDVDAAISVTGVENVDNLTLKHGDVTRVVTGNVTASVKSPVQTRDLMIWESGSVDRENSVNIEMSGVANGAHVVMKQTMTGANPTLITGEMIDPGRSLNLTQICLILFGSVLLIILVIVIFVLARICQKKKLVDSSKSEKEVETGINYEVREDVGDNYAEPLEPEDPECI